MTEYSKLSGLRDRNLFSQSSGGWEILWSTCSGFSSWWRLSWWRQPPSHCVVTGSLRNVYGEVSKRTSSLLSLHIGASVVVQMVKNLPAMQEIWVHSLGQKDPLEKGMATHSSILAWNTPHGQRSLVGYSPWGHKSLFSSGYKFYQNSLWPHFIWITFLGALSPITVTLDLGLQRINLGEHNFSP